MTKRLNNAVINHFESEIIKIEDRIINYKNHIKNDEPKWTSYWQKMINTNNRKLKDTKSNFE